MAPTSKLRTLHDGIRILLVIVRLLKQERPFHFFLAFTVVLAMLSLGLAAPVVVEYWNTGLVPRLPTAVLAAAIMILAFLSLAAGLILDTVTYGRREVKRLHYLSCPSPAAMSFSMPDRAKAKSELDLMPNRVRLPSSERATLHAHSSILRALLTFACWALGAAVFFRAALSSGFAVTSGDVADGRLIVYLHEHLYRWLLGQASFLSPAMFYPQTKVLGYTDAFLLDLVPYAAFRFSGLDPFLSAQLMAMGLSLLCFVSLTIILTFFLRFGCSLRLPRH